MRYLLTISISFLLVGLLQAQERAYFKKLDKAQDAFGLERYEEAFPIYKELWEEEPKRPEVAYAMGYILLNSEKADEQLKSLDYLNFAKTHINDTVPTSVFFHLARAHHLHEHFDQAISNYEAYAKQLPRNSQEQPLIEEYITQCRVGEQLLKNPEEVVVMDMTDKVNSPYAEIAPLINGEDNKLVFTSVRPKNELFQGQLSKDLQEWVFVSHRPEEGAQWEKAKMMEFAKRKDVAGRNLGASGLSPDGRKLLLYLSTNNGDLYEATVGGGKILSMNPISGQVNSKYQESSGSISADGKTLFFASDRPYGKGGFDIYTAKKKSNGQWGEVENMGDVVNTKFDERAPFIHPSGKFLYFHSNSLKSMGGDDIFKSTLVDGEWTEAQNMGSPINTPFNDNYFALSPDGKKGYFSSNRPGGKGNEDIYFLGIPEEQNIIPLTMIKGQILEGESGEPIHASIHVVDKATGEQVQEVYNPDPETGYYLLIFPPGNNYDMYIKAEGYTPYVVNIHVPNQTYFYELYQLIEMSPVKQFDEVVGQKVNVKNAFFDTGEKEKQKIPDRIMKEYDLVRDSVDLAEMLDLIIASEDKEAYEYFLDLIFMQKPQDVVDFENSERVSSGEATYYEDEAEMLDMVVLGDDTLYYAPGVDMTKPNIKEESRVQELPKELKAKTWKIFFGVGDAALDKKYHSTLDKINAHLQQYPIARLEIAGYADPTGDRKTNLKLSNERAQNVLNYFLEKGISRRRVIAKGFGQVKSEADFTSSENPAKMRRVEIKIVE